MGLLTQAVTLTANMVAGTDPILAGANGMIDRRLAAVQSRSAGAIEVYFGALGAAGAGIPLAAGARLDLDPSITSVGAIYIRGGSAAEIIVLLLG